MDPVLPPNVTAMKLRGLNYAGVEFDVLLEVNGEARFSRRGDSGTVALRREANGVVWLTSSDVRSQLGW